VLALISAEVVDNQELFTAEALMAEATLIQNAQAQSLTAQHHAEAMAKNMNVAGVKAVVNND
jgi:hypothetical protein